MKDYHIDVLCSEDDGACVADRGGLGLWGGLFARNILTWLEVRNRLGIIYLSLLSRTKMVFSSFRSRRCAAAAPAVERSMKR